VDLKCIWQDIWILECWEEERLSLQKRKEGEEKPSSIQVGNKG